MSLDAISVQDLFVLSTVDTENSLIPGKMNRPRHKIESVLPDRKSSEVKH